jgi:hypothetical protein
MYNSFHYKVFQYGNVKGLGCFEELLGCPIQSPSQQTSEREP